MEALRCAICVVCAKLERNISFMGERNDLGSCDLLDVLQKFQARGLCLELMNS